MFYSLHKNSPIWLFLWLFITYSANATSQYYDNNNQLNLPIIIKETAGTGVNNYPVSVVVPLPKGQYFNTTQFQLVDALNNPIDAQFEVVNQWWASDQSLRHIKIYFNTTVTAFTTAGTGTKTVFLRDFKLNTPPINHSLSVDDQADFITVTTGPLKFTVNKHQFSILSNAWLDTNKNGVFETTEQLLKPNATKGGVFTGRLAADIQIDSTRSDVKVVVEESGPLRVVIRAEALTHYKNPENHQHGFAVRIYAYADQSFVKVDYQLQNSSKDTKYSWPLYFEEMKLDLPMAFSQEPTVTIGTDTMPFSQLRGSGLELAQESHDIFKIRTPAATNSMASGSTSDGFLDASDGSKGVTVMTRNFWQMWANGLAIDNQDTVSVQLFPKWSAQWHEHKISDTGLYWLQDMQHVYKEVLFNFHDGQFPAQDMVNLSKTFQSYPVATLPTAWYQFTHVTLDMGGMVPLDAKLTTPDTRTINYPASQFSGGNYMFNWVNYGAQEPGYRVRSCTTGGWPKSVSTFIATENPSDYFQAELYALDEINVRPQSMAGYQHNKDFNLLKLTDNPYCGATWRAFEGHSTATYDAPLLANTGPYYYARDDQHGWHYAAEEAYYFTGNLWIKDWYQFMGQFRRTRLLNLDPYPSVAQRAIGHTTASALQAYRITGDTELLKLTGDFLNQYIRKNVVPETGGTFQKDASYTAGFFMHSVISYMIEVENSNPQAWAESFQLLSGVIDWNYQYCNFCYDISTLQPIKGISNSTSVTFTDPQAWYAWKTGQQKYMDHLKLYLTTGINGGGTPFGNPTHWNGNFNGRAVQFSLNHPKADQTPPAKITTLNSRLENGIVILNWASDISAKRYHIIWSYKPLLENPLFDSTQTNWFAANVIGQLPTPGANQSARITIPGGKIYAAVYAFDESGNLSAMSNMITQQGPLDTVPPSKPSQINSTVNTNNDVIISWQAANDNVKIQGYKIIKNGQEIAFVNNGLSFTDLKRARGQIIHYQVITVDTSGNQSATSAFDVSLLDGTNDLPVAKINAPSTLAKGQDIILDASGSFDINSVNGSNPLASLYSDTAYDKITVFQWDLDNDHLYGSEDTPAEPEGNLTTLNFGHFVGSKTISLRVTDSFGAYGFATQKLFITSPNTISVRLPITQDTIISKYNSNEKRRNLGGKDYISTFHIGIRRSLLKANMSLLPINTKIISAKLKVYVNTLDYPNKPSLSVFPVLQSWVEGTGTWGDAKNGATWYEYNYTDHNITTKNDWKNAGGDYYNNALDTQPVKAKTWLSFDISTIAQQWLQGTENNGLLIMGKNPGNNIIMYSKESSNIELRPYIEIIYEPVTVIETLISPITQDTIISQYNNREKRKNFGNYSYITTFHVGTRRSLLKSDINLPANTKILDAKLKLYIHTINYVNNPSISVFSMLSPWVEGTSTWGYAYDGATWYEYDYFDHATSTQNNWTQFGGDYDVSAALDTQAVSTASWVTLDVSSAVQSWVNGNTENNGLIILGLNKGNDIRINSSDSDRIDLHPYFEINYQLQ